MEEFTGGHTGPFYSKSGYCKSQPSRAPGCNDANYFYGGVPAYVSSDDHFNRKEDFTYSVAAYIYPDETYKIWDIAMYKNSRNKKHLA